MLLQFTTYRGIGLISRNNFDKQYRSSLNIQVPDFDDAESSPHVSREKLVGYTVADDFSSPRRQLLSREELSAVITTDIARQFNAHKLVTDEAILQELLRLAGIGKPEL